MSLTTSSSWRTPRPPLAALLGLGAVQCALGAYPEAWSRIVAALGQACALEYQHVVLDAVMHAAGVLLATGRAGQAPAPLALALVHPASRSHTTLRAQELLGGREELLPPEAFEAAVARGRGA